jgi:N-methylhydantoinase A
MGIRLGIDIGGTFTDFIALDGSGAVGVHKTPSTPRAPEEAVFTGLGELAEAAGVSLRDYLAQVELVIHGMTIATNTIIERSGPKTAVIHTEGFRDILEFRDGYKPDRYNLHMAPREPFVPRHLRLGVGERILHTGAVDAPLDEDSVRGALRTLRDEGVEAVAVCLLWSMVNDVHERRVIELIAEELPDVYATFSAEILPTIREYPRASATVLSAYVGPRLATYLDRLADHLAEHGYERDLLIMQVTGGIAAIDEIKRRPVFAIGSGPAAGPSGGASVGVRNGERDLLVIDMGGTSFEVSVVTDADITLTREMEVGGVPLGVAGVDVQSVGAGGGSVAWIDSGGMLRVGPRSAGADPGPACYGRGGEEPTVTDANLVLGYLNPDFFLGGRMELDRGLAEQALRRIAEPLNLTVTEAAAAVFRIVNTNMMGAVRAVTVMRGIDPRSYAMVTGGGAGGIHAAAIAEELGITKLIAPRVAGGLCAYGMVVADVRHSHVTTEPMRGGHFDAGAVAGIFSDMESSATRQLEAEGFDGGRIDLVRSADCKYPYQTNDITITLPDGIATADIGTEITELFHQEHERRYSYAARQMPVDVIAWRLTGIGRLPAATQPAAATNGAQAEGARAMRDVFFVGAGDSVATPVLDGEALHPGEQLDGPAIVEFPTTTVLVPPGHRMAVAAGGDLLIEKA